MRWFLPGWLLCFSATALPGQPQERSLIDRLLRPNMELRNPAQDKKFATNSAAVERRGTVGTFFLRPNPPQKSFADTRVLSAKQYSARSFNCDARVSSSTEIQAAPFPAALGRSTEVRDVRSSHQANKTVATRDFAGQREFREQGKSQKSLNRQNPPLTIEQVRELLNKNK